MSDEQTPVDLVKERFEKRALSLMGSYRTALVAAGFDCDDVEDSSCDQYEWALNLFFGPRNAGTDEKWNNSIGIELTIMESAFYDGEMEDGINFRVELVAMGGEIVGEFSPYNFTPQCWVDAKDNDAVERRFQLIEHVTADEVVGVIQEWLQRKGKAPATPA